MEKEQLKDMLKIQNALNIETCGSNWVLNECNGKADAIEWRFAIIDETTELIQSIGYEWWKKTETDNDNIKMEIIDLIHFTLSMMIINQKDDTIYYPVVSGNTNEKIINFVEEIVSNNPQYAFGILLGVAQDFKMDSNEVYKLYITKATLNLFRQKNGYKEGTYKKIWNGKEDNYWIQELYEDEDTSDSLYEKIENIYKEIK
jgi:dimeric dUTPase (all-alpha-NTP-PPase superfamily)